MRPRNDGNPTWGDQRIKYPGKKTPVEANLSRNASSPGPTTGGGAVKSTDDGKMAAGYSVVPPMEQGPYASDGVEGPAHAPHHSMGKA